MTVRAFGWEQNGIDENDRLVNISQVPTYLLAMIQRGLMFVLQLGVALLATCVVVLATQLRTSSALTGASLVTLMTFGDVLNYIIRWWTQIETSIGAVGRLKGFCEKVAPESLGDEDATPAKGWPFRGGIEIDRVSASYVYAFVFSSLATFHCVNNHIQCYREFERGDFRHLRRRYSGSSPGPEEHIPVN